MARQGKTRLLGRRVSAGKLATVCAAGSCLVVAGCWQEVHYEGPSQPDSRAVESSESRQSPTPPSADRLFRAGQPATPAKPETPETRAAASPQSPMSRNPMSHKPTSRKSPTLAEPDERSTAPMRVSPVKLEEHPRSDVDEFLELLDAATADDGPDQTAGNEQLPSERAAAAERRAVSDELRAGSESVDGQSADFANRRLAWKLACNWSMVGALRAKGAGPSVYQAQLEAAAVAAEKLGVQPRPWIAVASPASVSHSLAEVRGPELWRNIFRHAGIASAATAELACRCHRLLLAYTPDEDLAAEIAALQIAARESKLPAEIWEPLLKTLRRRGDFTDVKRAVFELDDRASEYFAEPSPR